MKIILSRKGFDQRVFAKKGADMMTIQDTIQFYKDNFTKCWEDEKYKWVAVQHYKEHWDIDAPDFAGMVAEAFGRAGNLLAGGMY